MNIVRRTVTAAALALLVSSCSSSSNRHVDLGVASARIEVVDGTGNVTQTVNVLVENDQPSALMITRNVAVTIRVAWLDATGMPVPGASDPSLQFRLRVPTGFGLSYAPSATNRFSGTLSGSTAGPEAIFVPMELFDAAENHVQFASLIPILVQ